MQAHWTDGFGNNHATDILTSWEENGRTFFVTRYPGHKTIQILEHTSTGYTGPSQIIFAEPVDK